MDHSANPSIHLPYKLPGTVPASEDDIFSIFLNQYFLNFLGVNQVSIVRDANAEIKLSVEQVADVVDKALLQTHLLLHLHHQLLKYFFVVAHEEDLERAIFSLVQKCVDQWVEADQRGLLVLAPLRQL